MGAHLCGEGCGGFQPAQESRHSHSTDCSLRAADLGARTFLTTPQQRAFVASHLVDEESPPVREGALTTAHDIHSDC